MGDIALRVENLTKEYRLGTIGYGTMREDLQSWWARVRGKDDPNSLVTASHHSESDKKHFLALDDISFDIKKGDRVGIIGKNGAGKSTLLKILSRITSPTKGNIYIDGRIGSLLEVGTGFHQELTGRENIFLNGSILGMKKWEIDKKLDEIIDFAGIEKFIDTPVKRYSSGMFVRLGFAVAAHLEPEILIVDEVLAVGDADFQKKAIGKMQDVSSNEGRTVLFVSHNMNSVRKLCNTGIFLENSRIHSYDRIDNVISDYLSGIHVNNSVVILENKQSYGDNEIFINSIELVNSKNNDFSIDNDQEIHFRLSFRANENLDALWFSLCFASLEGSNVFSLPSYESLGKLKMCTGEHIIDVKLKNRLRAGNYYIHLGVVNGSNDIWFQGYVSVLQVNPCKSYDEKKVGFIDNESTWELIDATHN